MTHCVQRTNIQNLKAIHNASHHFSGVVRIVFKERIYKIWKQFTTALRLRHLQRILCSKNEYTKSESNSQHRPASFSKREIVFKERIYKIWKQFTTILDIRTSVCWLCSKNEYTKSESNSQQEGRRHILRHRLCSKNEYTKSESNSQRGPWAAPSGLYCVQRTNIQNLKAIHNYPYSRSSLWRIVFKERIYKIWKQFTTDVDSGRVVGWLCSKNEYTKSESNSQPVIDKHLHRAIVFKERIYKIWKQFTTRWVFLRLIANCVQRTNIQNLKAIHNALWQSVRLRLLCSKNEYTKSESNSQQSGQSFADYWIVFKERIYKIWKQFTTLSRWFPVKKRLCSKNEYTKSESNSQRGRVFRYSPRYCVQRTNIQNLKAIHNSAPARQ